MFIYILENLINGKAYIGQTCNPKMRKRSHLNGYETGCVAIHNAVKKYGKDGFSFCILEDELNLAEANSREVYWIKQLNTLSPNGYNLREGGNAGGKPSKETIEKVRKANLGRIQSEEEKEKRATSHRGRKNSPETIKRMKLAAKNKPPEKCSMFGKKHSAKTKARMSLSHTKTHCKRGHPLDGENADVWISENGKRDCRACKRERRRVT